MIKKFAGVSQELLRQGRQLTLCLMLKIGPLAQR